MRREDAYDLHSFLYIAFGIIQRFTQKNKVKNV